MNTTTRKAEMYERIKEHGEQLLEIFPNATVRAPMELCKKLRRLEAEGEALGLRLCNDPTLDYDKADRIGDRILRKVNELLGNYTYHDKERVRHQTVPVFLNRDPRGYALKIRDEWMRRHCGFRLHLDWGGYGIIAPELSEGS